jgi:DNA-binding IclR family transcriptional regulator
MATTYKRIRSVYTTLKILEHLSDCREPITGSQIANDLDLPFHTVMCHLATHQDKGYVQVIGDKYKLGMKLAVFWARMKSIKEHELQGVQSDLQVLNGEI